jgi:hypothetical protein
MNITKMPRFTAEQSLGGSLEYSQHFFDQSLAGNRTAVIPAFRVNCGNNVGLGALCTALGGAAIIFPCFGSGGCMFVSAGLAFPPCFSCSYQD